MIEFHSQNDFVLNRETDIKNWISEVVVEEGYELGDVDFVFCNDAYLLDINQQFLQHDTYTDIISFDYRIGRLINGEIYISTERVEDNATKYAVPFSTELYRVIIHGVLHLCGYKDKSDEEAEKMRAMEDKSLVKLINN